MRRKGYKVAMTDGNHISLSELQRRIKCAVEEALPMPVWVAAEISELKVNYSGHCYMELVEKADDAAAIRGGRSLSGAPRAQARAVIWRSQYGMLSAYFEAETGSRLAAGMKILAKVLVSYHELYGLTLQIVDLDASYTLGEVERQRQLTIKRLQADGVWDMNRQTAMPMPVQRVAVVSSASAAGYRDFMNELGSGGYAFRTELFDAVVQGAAAEDSVTAALSAIAERADEFDAVVIIRGGGSVTDLSCFDSYRICSYVAQFPLPVITGIGHDKDTSVADMVAHKSLKTPTAVAAWLTDRMARIEAWLDESSRRLHDTAVNIARGERLRLERLTSDAARESGMYAERCRSALGLLREQIASAALRMVETGRSRLAAAEGVVEGRSPHRVMRMGFAVVRSGGRALLSTEGLRAGGRIEVELCDGALDADITSIKVKEYGEKE